ncbi:MAG: ComEC/Rec2 family competence protein [Bacteroidales bacterium]|nr:ComEC/Rec2 family competence protein [Bacteroidales bacterium]
MLHKELPFIRLLVPLCVGILTAYLSDLKLHLAVYLLVSSAVLLGGSLLIPTIFTNKLYGISLSMMLVSTGFILLRIELSLPDELSPDKNEYVVRVKSYPEPKANSYAVMTELIAAMGADGHHSTVRGSLLIYHSVADTLAPPMIPGDILTITVNPLPFTNRGNPFEFDYVRYMLKKGAKYYAFTRENALISIDTPLKRSLRDKAIIAGKKISGLYYNSGLTERNAALLSGLTLGQKDMIDDDTRESFARAGIMHIMAVSGLHAGVVSMFVFAMLFFLRGRLKIIRIIISIVVLWGFAFITGLSPSVERASLMFTFLHAGKILKRPVNSINSILAAAFIMLISKPSDLTTLSFQLSFSAVLFISGFYRRIASMVRTGFSPADKLFQLAAISVLAQLGTLPFTLNAFGRFPLWFLPANILIIPVASVIIIGAFFMVICSPLPQVVSLIAAALNYLIDFVVRCAEIFAQLPGLNERLTLLPWPETIALLLFIWAILAMILIQREKRILWPLLALLPFTAISSARYMHTEKSSELIVYNTITGSVTGFRSGHDLVLVADTNANLEPSIRHASVLSLDTQIIRTASLPVSTTFNKKHIIIANQPDETVIETHKPDILILNRYDRIGITAAETVTSQIIVTSGRPGVLISTRETANTAGIDIHYIQVMGCRRINFPSVDTN